VKFKLAVAGAGALLLVGLGIGASAYAMGSGVPFLAAARPTPSPDAGKQAACTDFLNHLGANLGVSQSKLGSALQKSADQTIDDAVKAGRITAAEGAKIKKQIDGGNVCSFRRGFEGGAGHGPRPVGLMMVLIKAAAETLNLTPDQLMTDVRQGKTLSSLAHGMTEDQFRQALLGHLKTDLDALVAQKKLSATQEASMLTKAKTAPIPFWNTAFKAGPRPFPGTPSSTGTDWRVGA